MATTTYNGKTYTRKTDRIYTHAVGVTDAKPRANQDADGIVAWCGSAELARKSAQKYSAAQWGFSKVQIVDVQQ